MYSKLFENLSYRMRNENALSDITWAFAQSNSTFRNYFLNFFFKDISSKDEILEFRREYVRNDCRPDFFISTKQKEYIIECKLYDRNYHFDQYLKTFPNSQFGYITIYKLNQQDNIITKTWMDFHKYLHELSEKLSDPSLKEYIQSYNSYLKAVCNIKYLNTMRLNDLSSLHSLNAIIERTLSEMPQLSEVSLDNKVKNIDESRYGRYYGLLKKGKKTQIWPWIGVYFDESNVMIYVEINKEWCQKPYEYLKKNDKIKTGKYFEPPYLDDEYRPCFAIELKTKWFEELNNKNDIKSQEKIIDGFLKEVLDLIDSEY